MVRASTEHQACPEVQSDIVVACSDLFVVLGNLSLEGVALFDVLGPLDIVQVPDFFVADVREHEVKADAGILMVGEPVFVGIRGIHGVGVHVVVGEHVAV